MALIPSQAGFQKGYKNSLPAEVIVLAGTTCPLDPMSLGPHGLNPGRWGGGGKGGGGRNSSNSDCD